MDEINSILEDLNNALSKLAEALSLGPEPDINRDGTIQRFEFSFELSWKLLKSVNGFLGTDCFSPRDCIRLAAQNSIIDNPEDWFEYLRFRNLASHVYDETTSLQIYNKIPLFEKNARNLIETVKRRIA